MSKVPFSSLSQFTKFYSTRLGAWCIKVNSDGADYSRWPGSYRAPILSFAPDEVVIV